jgi:hypothetical protein
MELVSVPFSVTADVARSTAPLRAGEPTESVRNQKRAEFNGPLRSELLGQLPGCAEGLSLLARDLGLRGEALEDLALGCREDLALLHEGVLCAIAFAFPSGFRPTAKLGQDFAAVHAPVADGEVLRAASAGITAVMKRGHVERGVWTLTALPSLSQHPDLARPAAHQEEDLFFRTEFQVLKALGGGWTGFSVRVEMTPWVELPASSQERIKASLASMSSASRSYKNLHEIAALLGV